MKAMNYSVGIAESVMQTPYLAKEKWCYEHGLVLKAIEMLWRKTKKERFYQYVKSSVDRFVNPDGTIRTYRLEDFNIDQINMGKVLFALWKESEDDTYRKAMDTLRNQLKGQPRTKEGASGIKTYIRIRCGWTASIWRLPFMRSLERSSMRRKPLRMWQGRSF